MERADHAEGFHLELDNRHQHLNVPKSISGDALLASELFRLLKRIVSLYIVIPLPVNVTEQGTQEYSTCFG
jgi:hypothetical protein